MENDRCNSNPQLRAVDWWIRPVESLRNRGDAAFASGEAGGQGSLGAAIKDYFYNASLWFALPFSIWLACGWPGLLLHWQAIYSEGRRAGTPVPLQAPLFESLSQSLAGEPSCAAMQSEAQ